MSSRAAEAPSAANSRVASVLLSPSMYSDLKALADARDGNLSAVLRRAIRLHIQREGRDGRRSAKA